MAEAGLYKSAADVPKGTPTPTQDELNRMALGETVECAPDGSGPDPHNQPLQGTIYGVKPTAAPATHATHQTTRHSSVGSSRT
jgi:hypothetical protein